MSAGQVFSIRAGLKVLEMQIMAIYHDYEMFIETLTCRLVVKNSKLEIWELRQSPLRAGLFLVLCSTRPPPHSIENCRGFQERVKPCLNVLVEGMTIYMTQEQIYGSFS